MRFLTIMFALMGLFTLALACVEGEMRCSMPRGGFQCKMNKWKRVHFCRNKKTRCGIQDGKFVCNRKRDQIIASPTTPNDYAITPEPDIVHAVADSGSCTPTGPPDTKSYPARPPTPARTGCYSRPPPSETTVPEPWFGPPRPALCTERGLTCISRRPYWDAISDCKDVWEQAKITVCPGELYECIYRDQKPVCSHIQKPHHNDDGDE